MYQILLCQILGYNYPYLLSGFFLTYFCHALIHLAPGTVNWCMQLIGSKSLSSQGGGGGHQSKQTWKAPCRRNRLFCGTIACYILAFFCGIYSHFWDGQLIDIIRKGTEMN